MSIFVFITKHWKFNGYGTNGARKSILLAVPLTVFVFNLVYASVHCAGPSFNL